MFTDDKHVKVEGLVVWDGISKPETQDDGSLKHNLKIAVAATDPALAELQQLATAALACPRFNGVLPPGANWPLKEIDPAKFGDTAALVQGMTAFNAGTTRGVPQMYDVAGSEMPAMANYNHVLYAGAKVSVLVHTYDYGQRGNTGVAFGLDGIMVVDANAPKLDVTAGLSQSAVAAAFGVSVGAPGAPAPGAPALPPATPPDAPVAPPAAAGPVMTPKAAGKTYEAFTGAGWTHDQLVDEGYVAAGGPAPAPGFLTPGA